MDTFYTYIMAVTNIPRSSTTSIMRFSRQKNGHQRLSCNLFLFTQSEVNPVVKSARTTRTPDLHSIDSHLHINNWYTPLYVCC